MFKFYYSNYNPYLKSRKERHSDMKKHKHSSHLCRYHFVWIPKYRKSTLQGTVKALVEDLITYHVTFRGGKILELAVMPDHVHLFCELAPSIRLDEFIGKLKSYCTSQLFASFENLRVSTNNSAFWARGYFVGTCGVDANVIESYIRSQR